MELKKRIFTGAVAGYLFLPILIFFVGWTRWYFALLLLAGVGFSVFTMVKKEQSFSFPEKHSDKTMFLVVLLFFGPIFPAWADLFGKTMITPGEIASLNFW